MEKKFYSRRFKNLLLWEGVSPSSQTIDIERTDRNIQLYLDEKNARWGEDNPETDGSHNYDDWLEISNHQHWIEMNEELTLPENSLICWVDLDEYEIEIMVKEAGLCGKINFDIVKLNDTTEIRFHDRERCVCLPQNEAHEVLENCALSSNTRDYFWHLAYSAK